MRLRISSVMLLGLGAAGLLIAGCGGDESTGPEYGDLGFSPASPVLIGSARQVDLEMGNLSNGSLGPLTIGAGALPLSVPRGFTCPGLVVVITPSQVQSLAGGASVQIGITFSFADLTEEECPLATYEVDLNAALGSTVLGSSQIRIDHLALE